MAKGWLWGSFRSVSLVPLAGLAAALTVSAPAAASPLPVPAGLQQAQDASLVSHVSHKVSHCRCAKRKHARRHYRKHHRPVIHVEQRRYHVGWPGGRIEATGRQITDAPVLGFRPYDDYIPYPN